MIKTNSDLSQDTLKKYLTYHPESGAFTWNIRASKNTHIGSVAGWKLTGNWKKAEKKYQGIKIQRASYLAHRLAFLYMTGDWPDNEVDHIDGNGLNNKWENLADVTHAENCRNQKLRCTNTSGCTGVSWHKETSKWRARIKVNYKMISLGLYKELQGAIKARKDAEVKYGFHPNHGQVRPL